MAEIYYVKVPHFHHELVFEAVYMVIESIHEKTEEAMCKLLASLFRRSHQWILTQSFTFSSPAHCSNPPLSNSFVITTDQIKFFFFVSLPTFLILFYSFVITIDQMRAGFQRIYDMMGDISIDVPQVSTDIMHHDFQLNDMLSSVTKHTSESVHSLTLSSRLTWCLSVSCCGAAVLESSMMRWSGRWELLQWLKFIKFQSGWWFSSFKPC